MIEPTGLAPAAGPQRFRVPLVIALCLFGVVLVRTAWVGDDAYITLRTVDNFVNGYGLTWNVAERVQSYTHPLWLFALSAVYSVTHAPYFTIMVVSITISLAAVALVVLKYAGSGPMGLLAATMLILSKAFVDYSTSGLENPLSHLLLAGFLIVYYQQPPTLKRGFLLSLLASLGLLNRMDLALIFAPVLLAGFAHRPTWRMAGVMALGQLPFLLWEAFSLLYYGFPFPNTAYTKILVGDVDQGALWQQGWFYLANLLQMDPLTPVVILGAVGAVLIAGHRQSLPVVLGIALYAGYVVSIGGDFMSGRFFSAPLLAAVMVLVRVLPPSLTMTTLVLLLALLFGVGFAAPNPTLRSGEQDGYTVTGPDELPLLAQAVDRRGIADERAYYYSHTGLLRRSREDTVPNRIWWELVGRRLTSAPPVMVERNVGFLGFYAGRTRFIVDEYALTDPLLARLPPARTVNWRVGHLARVVPEGYVETLTSGENHLVDPALAHYYDQLALIVRGPIFDPARLRAIWYMNLGEYDHLVDFDRYRYPDMRQLQAAEVSQESATAQPVVMADSGLEIRFDASQHARLLEVSVQPDNSYQILYFDGERRVAAQTITYTYHDAALVTHTLPLPSAVQEHGVDRIWILPMTAHGERYIGHLRLHE